MKTSIQIRTKSTGLYFIADKGFVTSKRDEATKYEDTTAIRAAFNAQYDGELQFIGDNQYADGAASLPTTPLTQAEIDADLEEKRNWLPFPSINLPASENQMTTVGMTKPKEMIRLVDSDTAPVWIRGHYDKSSKTYSLTRADDVNHEIFRKPTTKCFTGFTY